MTFTQGYTLLTIYGEESASKFHFEIAFTCKAFAAAASAMLCIRADASDLEKQILLKQYLLWWRGNPVILPLMTFTQGYTLLTIYGEESASKFHFEIAFTCKAFAAASAMLGIPADASDREKQILLTSRKIVIADGIHMRGVRRERNF
ncbi:hypothetical protein CDAR_197911 [Caerostris darwini]|uniref:Uncharacterized protein n=1 Tax=Caerostris darwini TaxID=1538125 RepID=A0AAV4SAT2_9ARAC|nr:hypothetical protein CDAR_197911 [Caerostris darwini]